MRARLLVRRGEPGPAGRGPGRRPGADDELSYLREFEHITLARILLARHRSEQERRGRRLAGAIGLLERLLAAAEADGRQGTVLELLVLLALARQPAGTCPGPRRPTPALSWPNRRGTCGSSPTRARRSPAAQRTHGRRRGAGYARR